MNFSPFYYQVQEIIRNDDDKALRNIFNDLEQREEFNSYHEDFLHCTYPNSFKCLYFLMNDMNRRYNVHSILSHCFKNNNDKWLTLFLETLQKKKEELKSDQTASSILDKNVFTMKIDLDYSCLLNSNQDVWDTMFSHHSLELFKPHVLVNEIFENDQYSKIYLIEELCNKHNFELPIIDILSKAFSYQQLDIVEYFLEKYQPQLNSDEKTDLLNMVGLSGSKENFQYFTQHFLSFEEFNKEQLGLVFNAGLLTGKLEIIKHLKENFSIDFYPLDSELKKEFIQIRHTMWEDNDENSSSTLSLIKNVQELFDLYQWNKAELKEEVRDFEELSALLSKFMLNEKLNKSLEAKNIHGNKAKI